MIKQQNVFSRNKGVFRNSQTTQSNELIYDSFFDDCVNVTINDNNNHTRNNDKYVASLFNHVYINQCFPDKDIEDVVAVTSNKKKREKRSLKCTYESKRN